MHEQPPLPNAPYKSVCSHCGQKLPDSRKPLTSRQRHVYQTIKRYQERYGVVPSYSTLAKLIAVRSLDTVSGLLDSLQKKGWLSKGPKGRAQSMILRGD